LPAIERAAQTPGPTAEVESAVLVEIEKLSYRYPSGGGMALDGVDLAIRRGEFLALIGPTGAGKSTLCLCLNGIVPQFFGGDFYGRTIVDGLDTTLHPTHALAHKVGMVFEDPGMQLVAPSVRAEVAFPLENLGLPPTEIRARVTEVLALVRLEGFEDKHPARLSGGQQQRLAIAAAVATRPDLLVLDEPTSQLDPQSVREVLALILRLNQEHGITVLLVSHAVEQIAETAHRVALLAEGRLVTSGRPSELFQDTDLLATYGIRLPQVTETFLRLRDRPPGALPVTMTAALAWSPRLAVQPVPEPPDEPRSIGAPAIEVSGLRHVYPDGTEALCDVSLTIHYGDYVAILGQNGGGKSTLVRHFLHLLEPTAGTVCVAGQDVTLCRVSDLAQQIGYVAQNPDQQIFCGTVTAEVAFALEHIGLPPHEVRERVAAALAEMRLAELADRHPFSLSKADRARTVIAAVLAMRPDILVFDEPTTGQDDRGARAIMELTSELHSSGRTVVLITHHLHLLADHAERVVLLGEGRVLLDAPLRDALYAGEVLARTSLEPPQAVRLAEALGAAASRPLTPAALACQLVPA
jgi:energy-coupling factor transport system ATP-binding protein